MLNIQADFIQEITPSESIILNSNYIIFDPSLWAGAHQLLKEIEVDFHLIGLNVFTKPERTPTLIDLNSLSEDKKIELWNQIGRYNTTNAFSQFDQMNMMQTYIKSTKDLEDFKKFLADFMIIRYQGEKAVFRFYDPRVAIHFINLFSLIDKNRYYKKWLEYTDKWLVSVNQKYYEIKKTCLEESIFDFDSVDEINNILREESTVLFDEEGNEKEAIFQPLNQMILNTYKKFYIGKNDNG